MVDCNYERFKKYSGFNKLVDIPSIAKQCSVQTFLFNCNDVLKTILFIEEIHHFWDGMRSLYPNFGVEDYSNDYFNIINNDKFF